jgi:hypothetical protein
MKMTEKKRGRIMDWLRRVMVGRYGVDQLSIGLLILDIVLGLVNQFVRTPVLSVLCFLILILCYVRIFSRNIQKRYEENCKFLKLINPVRYWFKKTVRRAKESKTHCFYKCPNCRQTIRVPRGKGKIQITCPKCRTQFIKKT